MNPTMNCDSKVFIGGVPYDISEDELKDEVMAWGNVIEYYYPTPFRGWAVARFKSSKDRNDFLSSKRRHAIKNKIVDVKPFRPPLQAKEGQHQAKPADPQAARESGATTKSRVVVSPPPIALSTFVGLIVRYVHPKYALLSVDACSVGLLDMDLTFVCREHRLTCPSDGCLSYTSCQGLSLSQCLQLLPVGSLISFDGRKVSAAGGLHLQAVVAWPVNSKKPANYVMPSLSRLDRQLEAFADAYHTSIQGSTAASRPDSVGPQFAQIDQIIAQCQELSSWINSNFGAEVNLSHSRQLLSQAIDQSPDNDQLVSRFVQDYSLELSESQLEKLKLKINELLCSMGISHPHRDECYKIFLQLTDRVEGLTHRLEQMELWKLGKSLRDYSFQKTAIDNLGRMQDQLLDMKSAHVANAVMKYIRVTTGDTNGPNVVHDLRLDHHGNLQVKTVTDIFPGATMLLYRSEVTGNYRSCPIQGSIFLQPENGWGERLYLANTAVTSFPNMPNLAGKAAIKSCT